MDGAGRVDLGLEGAGGVGELGSGEDVEVVVCGVAAGVALSSDGSAEDDEVFGDALTGLLARAVRRRKKEKGKRGEGGIHTGVNHVHGAHGTAGIVKDPLLVEVDVLGVLLVEVRDDEVDNGLGVLGVSGDGALGELVELLVVEDAEAVVVALGEGDEGREDDEGDGEELHPAGDRAAAAAGGGGLGGSHRVG